MPRGGRVPGGPAQGLRARGRGPRRGDEEAPRVKPPRIRRPTALLERQWPWLLIALAITLVLVSVTVALGLGVLDCVDPFWFGRNFRGYTAGGLAMGVVATGLALLSAAYSIRKRRAATGGTSMMTW